MPMVSNLCEERESTPAESSASESAGDKVMVGRYAMCIFYYHLIHFHLILEKLYVIVCLLHVSKVIVVLLPWQHSMFTCVQ